MRLVRKRRWQDIQDELSYWRWAAYALANDEQGVSVPLLRILLRSEKEQFETDPAQLYRDFQSRSR